MKWGIYMGINLFHLFQFEFPNCNVSLCAIGIGLNAGRLGFIRPVYGGGQRWNNEGCDDSE